VSAFEVPSEEVSARMRRQRNRDTNPEVELRSALWQRGLRYRVDHRVDSSRRRVDIAFTRQRVAVFVDGCFWHSCPAHRTVPKTNREWWVEKLAKNVKRDQETNLTLQGAGWKVIRIWEHEDLAEAADRIEREVRLRTRSHSQPA
jgi:DNA mismatch endonuclease (patch repair protein)